MGTLSAWKQKVRWGMSGRLVSELALFNKLINGLEENRSSHR